MAQLGIIQVEAFDLLLSVVEEDLDGTAGWAFAFQLCCDRPVAAGQDRACSQLRQVPLASC